MRHDGEQESNLPGRPVIGLDRVKGRRRMKCLLWTAVMVLFACPVGAGAQTWYWTSESVDPSAPSTFTSIAVDHQGNAHVAYAGDGGSSLKYAFRSSSGNRWFTMLLDSQLQEFAMNLALDPRDNPHICYTPRQLKYAYFDGSGWKIEPIAPGQGSIEYNCSVLVGTDGAPQVLWYHTRSADGTNYLHLKHAVLRDGVWTARTVDFDGEAGKWNSMVLDNQGQLHAAYSAFPAGTLRFNDWNGTTWSPQGGISATDRTVAAGMGNSLVLNSMNQMEISFYEGPMDFVANHGQTLLKFARQKGAAWSEETVDSVVQRAAWKGYRSTVVLDSKGFPHICYEDGGALKHAYSDGARWRIQVVVPRGIEPYLYSAMAIARDDTLYISYRDASDGSLKVAIGHSKPSESTSTASSTAGRPDR